MDQIRDTFGRVIDYLRISITDRCTLRCVYCRPPEGIGTNESGDRLHLEEILRIVQVAAGLGVKKIRITGGEPLLRKDLPLLIEANEEVKARVGALAPLAPLKIRKSGPARYYRLKGAQGVIGFISPMTHHFCDSCNRLRITADGRIRPCLFSDEEVDLKIVLRNGFSDRTLEEFIRFSVALKPFRRPWDPGIFWERPRLMSRIGG